MELQATLLTPGCSNLMQCSVAYLEIVLEGPLLVRDGRGCVRGHPPPTAATIDTGEVEGKGAWPNGHPTK